MNLPKVKLSGAGQSVAAYVARSAQDRALGLMHCRELKEGEGMLFVCDRPARQSFWMKDTPVPLSAAFIADDGTILQIVHMEPNSTRSHRSRQAVRYVLEVPQGWFESNGVREGERLEGAVFLATEAQNAEWAEPAACR